MPARLIVNRDSAPRSLNVGGEQIAVLASGVQTGSYGIFFQAGPEDSGPPLHRECVSVGLAGCWRKTISVIDGPSKACGLFQRHPPKATELLRHRYMTRSAKRRLRHGRETKK